MHRLLFQQQLLDLQLEWPMHFMSQRIFSEHHFLDLCKGMPNQLHHVFLKQLLHSL